MPEHAVSHVPQPLGPDSLTWTYLGDLRMFLFALWAGSMQNMHPGLGAGVSEHSTFFDERWQRIFRSVYPILGVVYDGPRAAETAKQVRGYHRGIHGVDVHGRRYNALEPETWFWAHSTFLMLSFLITEHFGRPLGDADKEKLYAEGIQWYRLYGVSARAVPPDWTSFCAYWDHMCTDVLEDTPAARAVLDIGHIEKPPMLPALPDAVWALLRIPVTRSMVWITVGLYPEAVRRRMGYRWTAADQFAFVAGGRAVGLAWKLVPRPLRYHPRARAAWRRARGGALPSESLVDTPDRYLPAEADRDDPKHYVRSATSLTG